MEFFGHSEDQKKENKVERFDEELLREKLFTAWGSARDQYGVPNNNRLAHLFYKSLYKSENFNDKEIVDERGFGRVDSLRKKMELSNNIIPDEEEFVQIIVRALTSDINFSENLYDGAMETVESISDFGPIVIWTRGDVFGNEESKGSGEQIKKIATAELGTLRKKIATKRGIDRKDVLTVRASEDKIDSVESVINSFKEKGIHHVVIIDDLVKNLDNAIHIAESIENIKVYPILVCQGINHSKKRKEKLGDVYEENVKRLNGVVSISEVEKKMEEFDLLKGETGIMLDFDDVLSDDSKRMDAQFESVSNKLKEKNWI